MKSVLVRATFTFPKSGASVVEHRFVDGVPVDPGRPGPVAAPQGVHRRGLDGRIRVRPWRVRRDRSWSRQGRIEDALQGPDFPSVIVNPVMVPAGNLTERSVTSSRFDVARRRVRQAGQWRGRDHRSWPGLGSAPGDRHPSRRSRSRTSARGSRSPRPEGAGGGIRRERSEADRQGGSWSCGMITTYLPYHFASYVAVRVRLQVGIQR